MSPISSSALSAVGGGVPDLRPLRLQLLADAAGKPRVMTEDEVTLAHRQFSNANTARHNFNLLADLVMEEEPTSSPEPAATAPYTSGA